MMMMMMIFGTLYLKATCAANHVQAASYGVVFFFQSPTRLYLTNSEKGGKGKTHLLRTSRCAPHEAQPVYNPLRSPTLPLNPRPPPHLRLHLHHQFPPIVSAIFFSVPVFGSAPSPTWRFPGSRVSAAVSIRTTSPRATGTGPTVVPSKLIQSLPNLRFQVVLKTMAFSCPPARQCPTSHAGLQVYFSMIIRPCPDLCCAYMFQVFVAIQVRLTLGSTR